MLDSSPTKRHPVGDPVDAPPLKKTATHTEEDEGLQEEAPEKNEVDEEKETKRHYLRSCARHYPHIGESYQAIIPQLEREENKNVTDDLSKRDPEKKDTE